MGAGGSTQAALPCSAPSRPGALHSRPTPPHTSRGTRACPARAHLPGLDLRPVQRGLPHPWTWAPALSRAPHAAALSRFARNPKVSSARGSRAYRFCLGWKSNKKPFTAHFCCRLRGAQSGSTVARTRPGHGARGPRSSDRCAGLGSGGCSSHVTSLWGRAPRLLSPGSSPSAKWGALGHSRFPETPIPSSRRTRNTGHEPARRGVSVRCLPTPTFRRPLPPKTLLLGPKPRAGAAGAMLA